jgi:hypothetical protein
MPTIPAGYQALAWPSSKVLAQLQPGQSVPVTPISNTAALAGVGMSNNGEAVNLELAPVTPSGSATAPVTPSGSATATGSTSPVPSTPGASSSSLAAPAAAMSPDIVCSQAVVFRQDLGYIWGNVGESFSEIPNATQAFQYSVTNSQTTTFGVGVSITGDAGTWSASGTSAFNTGYTSTQTWPRETGVVNNAWASTFEEGLYEQVYTCFPQNDFYIIRPYEWTAGAQVTHPSSVPALDPNNCRAEPKGSNFQANNSTATTITHGFDVRGGTVVNLGFTGTAQTGYSTNAQIGFDFNQNGALCGSNGPPNYAGQYVAHA